MIRCTAKSRGLGAGLLAIMLLAGGPALATPGFIQSEITGGGEELLFADLDGDGLQDFALLDGLNVAAFYQDPKGGFRRQPAQSYRLTKPALVWLAKLGRNAESVLVMTSDGVAELSFTNRAGPPVRAELISQRTLLPETADKPSAKHFPLSAKTGGGRPLVLAPVGDGLQVWSYRGGWQLAQTIAPALERRLWPSVANPGYTAFIELSLSLGDINGDSRDDIIIRHGDVTGRQTYALYLQEANGLFGSKPALTYAGKADSRSWLCWADINRDGKVDLIRSVLSRDPWFMPGSESGKVVVGVLLADERGSLPVEPQQVFRKNDSLAALPVVDVDGDGYPDLILGGSPFDSRESFRRLITAKRVEVTLRCHFYRPGAGYPKEPDCEAGLLIRVDQCSLPSALQTSRALPQYFDRFVKLTGDFNGDGRKDLLVRDRGATVSVHFFLSRERGFSREPNLRFDGGGPIDWVQARDLNDDGVSDLIMKLQDQGAFRVFTSDGK